MTYADGTARVALQSVPRGRRVWVRRWFCGGRLGAPNEHAATIAGWATATQGYLCDYGTTSRSAKSRSFRINKLQERTPRNTGQMAKIARQLGKHGLPSQRALAIYDWGRAGTQAGRRQPHGSAPGPRRRAALCRPIAPETGSSPGLPWRPPGRALAPAPPWGKKAPRRSNPPGPACRSRRRSRRRPRPP